MTAIQPNTEHLNTESSLGTPPVFQHQDLSVAFTTGYTKIWDDEGSGADMDVCGYRPLASAEQAAAGYMPLGDLLVPNKDDPNANVVSLLVRDVPEARVPGKGPAVVIASGVTPVYHGEVYMLTAPDGYTALGGTAVYEDDPTFPQNYVCVRNDLLVSAQFGAQIYNDHGTGRSDDLSTWRILPPSPTLDQPGVIYLSPGTFLPSGSLDGPDPQFPPYALQLDIQDPLPPGRQPTPVPPKLHDLNPPPAFGEKITYITLLPWFAVQDDTMAEADRILKSPVYSLNRTDVYKLLMNQYNDTRVDQKVRYTMMTGVSHDTTEEFAHSVGIELGAEYTIVPKVLTGSVKLTYNFTYTSSSTDHMETQKTYELELTIPAGTNAAVYMIESTYQLRRQDGTLVSNVTPDYGVPSSSYTTQYPPASDTQPAVTQSEPRLLKA